MKLKKGKTYQGKVEKVIYGGKGIVKIDDFVIFVEKAITGQEIEFQITKLKKTYAQGKLKKVLKKAPNEIVAKCQHFGECGGCKWQNLSYEDQLNLKSSIVKENIEQVVDADTYSYEEILPSPQKWQYRNKLDFSYGYQEMKIDKTDKENWIYHDLYPCLGFHRPKKFELIIPIEKCEISPEEANQILAIMQKFRNKHDLSVHNPKTHKGFMRNVIVRKGERTGDLLVNIIVNTQDKQEGEKKQIWEEITQDLRQLKGIVGILLTYNKSWNDAVIDGHTDVLWGQDFLHDKIGDLTFKISPESFFQTNTLGAKKLYDTVQEFAALQGSEKVLDLYCGTGTIGLYLANKAKQIYGIEIIEAAIENAKVNAKINKIENAEFICGNIDKSLNILLEKVDSQMDLVILDPPRNGVGKKALERVLKINAKKIVYVSCNPTTFARDLEILNKNGYKLKKARAVDMFPHTHHIEMVAEIVR